MTEDAEKPAREREESAGNGTIIQSVVVATQVLEALAAAGKPVRLTEIARGLGEAKARIHRHLTTLKHAGLVDQDRTTDYYRLGWKLVHLGQAAADQFEIRRLAEPYMRKLRDLSRQTVVLSVPANGEAMVADVLESANLVTISVRRGMRLPAHASAQGRIVLAFAPPETQRRVLARKLTAFTSRTLTNPVGLRRRLARIREELYEAAPGETLLGISTLAAPILDHDDTLVGVIAMVGAEQDIPSPAAPAQLRLIRACAAALSGKLHATAFRRRNVPTMREFALA